MGDGCGREGQLRLLPQGIRRSRRETQRCGRRPARCAFLGRELTCSSSSKGRAGLREMYIDLFESYLVGHVSFLLRCVFFLPRRALRTRRKALWGKDFNPKPKSLRTSRLCGECLSSSGHFFFSVAPLSRRCPNALVFLRFSLRLPDATGGGRTACHSPAVQLYGSAVKRPAISPCPHRLWIALWITGESSAKVFLNWQHQRIA